MLVVRLQLLKYKKITKPPEVLYRVTANDWSKVPELHSLSETMQSSPPFVPPDRS